MTTSRKRTAAVLPQVVLLRDAAKMSYLTLGDGPAVMVIRSGDASAS